MADQLVSLDEGEQIASRLRSGTVNVDEGYALAWGSFSVCPRWAWEFRVWAAGTAEGPLNNESQTISTSKVLNLDRPSGTEKSR